MTQLPLESHIEALLFYKAEPVSFKKLAEMLKVEEVAIEPAINVLAQQLQNRGLSLIIKDASVALVTNPLVSEGIKQLQKEELSKNLSKAALETLTIVLYRGPIRRSEIDHIRGVNSQFSIRLLLVRGLIEKSLIQKTSAHICINQVSNCSHISAFKKLRIFRITQRSILRYNRS